MKITFFAVMIDMLFLLLTIGGSVMWIDNIIMLSIFVTLGITTALKLNYNLSKYYKQKGW